MRRDAAVSSRQSAIGSNSKQSAVGSTGYCLLLTAYCFLLTVKACTPTFQYRPRPLEHRHTRRLLATQSATQLRTLYDAHRSIKLRNLPDRC